MICSSCPVPRVVTTSACVSPRVNKAEPCALGRTPTSDSIGRTVFVSRPSIRLPVSKIDPRTISASIAFKTSPATFNSSSVSRSANPFSFAVVTSS